MGTNEALKHETVSKEASFNMPIASPRSSIHTAPSTPTATNKIKTFRDILLATLEPKPAVVSPASPSEDAPMTGAPKNNAIENMDIGHTSMELNLPDVPSTAKPTTAQYIDEEPNHGPSTSQSLHLLHLKSPKQEPRQDATKPGVKTLKDSRWANVNPDRDQAGDRCNPNTRKEEPKSDAVKTLRDSRWANAGPNGDQVSDYSHPSMPKDEPGQDVVKRTVKAPKDSRQVNTNSNYDRVGNRCCLDTPKEKSTQGAAKGNINILGGSHQANVIPNNTQVSHLRHLNTDKKPFHQNMGPQQRKFTKHDRKIPQTRQRGEQDNESPREPPRLLMDMEEFKRDVEKYNLKTLKDSRWA
ncbi:hypothetical protein SAMD00023353_5200800 [Rosellinia necatrix]|uniref:Uncharacterized protein n=1 Tax=Rosellinia necatrix TaxID=77044 RepID=A0A1W2TQL3_ROSNE|nr:hypothetical protein SAMD00023353_5200800 [Rosellinia necatrix]